MKQILPKWKLFFILLIFFILYFVDLSFRNPLYTQFFWMKFLYIKQFDTMLVYYRNSPNITYFWQNWNIPIHRWGKRLELNIIIYSKDYKGRVSKKTEIPCIESRRVETLSVDNSQKRIEINIIVIIKLKLACPLGMKYIY